MSGLIIVLLGVNTVLLAGLLLRRTSKPVPVPAPHLPPKAPTPQLSAPERERLEQLASTAFEKAVDHATAQFGENLEGTSERLNQLIVKLTTDIVQRELDQYKESLGAARTEALKSMAGMQQALEERQRGLQGDIEAELSKRRQYLLDRLDHKLGAAVSAYIVEALGQSADVGAQRRFLLESLERHKADLKKEFSDEG